MLHMLYLAEAIQADREREIRSRAHRFPSVPSRLRHPPQAIVEAHAEPIRQRADATSIGRPATAGSR